jgi:hypothetical protein
MGPRLIRGAFVYTGGMAIDADGARRAYKLGGGGLDALGNAGHGETADGQPANWFGVETDTGKPTGHPIVQDEDDPAPGFLVSTTALRDHAKDQKDPTAYLDSSTETYISVARDLYEAGCHPGDLAVAVRNGQPIGCITGDVGPKHKYGEASIATADAAGVPGQGKVRGRGLERGVTYVVFPGSRTDPAWPRETQEYQEAALAMFASWGGLDALANV